jgi:putative transposase
MLKAYKYRLYPTETQKQLIQQHAGNCRWLWNYCLHLSSTTYKETGKGLSRYNLQKLIPQLKVENDWLALAYSQCLQSVLLNLDTSFKNFFKKRGGYPSFKSKHGRQSFQFPQNVKLDGNQIKFPGKIGKVDIALSRKFEGKIKTCTISITPSGQYFVSILVDDEREVIGVQTTGKAIGIDLGITSLITDSEGNKTANPKWSKHHEKNLKKKQQSLSRKVKDCNNRNKARKLVARVHSRIANVRADFLHKLSRKIVNENQVVCVENLNVKGMIKNRKLSKAISQVSWGMFKTMLKYKCEWAGKAYVEVDRFYPSSKTCSHCGTKIEKLPLDIREWTCSHCLTIHDRDINAAINIREEGLRILASGTGATAYCLDVRQSSVSAVMQSIG